MKVYLHEIYAIHLIGFLRSESKVISVCSLHSAGHIGDTQRAGQVLVASPFT